MWVSALLDALTCRDGDVFGRDDIAMERVVDSGDGCKASGETESTTKFGDENVVSGELERGRFLLDAFGSPSSVATDRGVFEAEPAALQPVEGETPSGGGVRAMTASGVVVSSSGLSRLLSICLLSLCSKKMAPRIEISVSLPMLRRKSICRRA